MIEVVMVLAGVAITALTVSGLYLVRGDVVAVHAHDTDPEGSNLSSVRADDQPARRPEVETSPAFRPEPE